MKNTDKTLTRADLDQAIYSKSLINPVVENLKKITLKSCNDDLGSYTEIQDFTHWLGSFIKSADEIINQCECDYDARDKGLITRASNRLAQIPNDVLRGEFEVKQLAESYSMKVAELKKKGFDDYQISQIVPDPQAEIERYAAILAELKIEPALIGAFLSDAPRYSLELLIGTQVQLSI